MTNSNKSKDEKLSRRDFLKTGLASGAALVLNGLTQKVALAENSVYWGTDSATASCLYCGMAIP